MTDEVFQAGVSLPEDTNIQWDGPKPVKHYVIGVDLADPVKDFDGKLAKGVFRRIRLYKRDYSDPKASVDGLENISIYAQNLIDNNGNYPNGPEKEPLDMNIRSQCWIIVELENDKGWEFAKNHPAVTTKTADKHFLYQGLPPKKYGFNANLRYVTTDKRVLKYEEIQETDECRMIFFRALYREAHKARGMNFVVDLLETFGESNHRIPIIIDPDVPDDGTEGFPSPP